LQLRAYTFDRYKTKRKEREERPAQVKVTIAVAASAAVEKAFAPRRAVADGVVIARDLVNEPANVLYPENSPARPAA
jgi:leucyl aminopeptidase